MADTVAAAMPVNVHEYEAAAQAVLSPMVYDFVAGGAGDEETLRANREAFRRWRLLPRVLAGPTRKTAPPPRRRRDEDDDDDEDDDELERRRRRRKAAASGGSQGVVIALVIVGLFVVVGVGAGVWAFTRKKSDTASTSTAPSTSAPGIGGPAKSNSNNAGKIEGTKWTSMAGNVKGKRVPAGALRLEFARDGRMTYDTPTGRYTGTYSLGFGDTVTWNFDRPLAGVNQHQQRVSINGNRMTVSDTDGTSLSFEPD